MVTDIHDWSLADADQPHPVFSVQHSHPDSDIQTATTDDNPRCGVCSYDHGGHMGQALAALSYVTKSFPAQNSHQFPLQSEIWYSRKISPKLRPPIA